MATLLNTGSTYCQANLELRIKRKADWVIGTPVETYSTNNAITRNATCGQNNVTDEPDYFLHYETGEVGEYEIELKNLDTGFVVTDSFKIENDSPFVIERIGATRINPFKSKYTMHVKVTAKEDWKGYIEEKVPAVFAIDAPNDQIPEFEVRDHEGEKIIRWNAELDEGESIELQYTYDAPKVSPQFYLLGPMKVFDPNFIQNALGLKDAPVFEEVREWQIASDAVGLRAVSANTAVAASGNVSVPMPTGTTFNDVMIMAIMGRDNVVVTLPTGWTKYIEQNNGTTLRTTMAWKRATSTEAGPYTVTHAAGNSIVAAIATFSGATITGDPILASSTRANTAAATTTATSTTNSVANSMAVFTSHVQDDVTHTDASWKCATDPLTLTEAFDYNTALGNDAALAMATAVRSGVAATGLCTVPLSLSILNSGTITLLKAHTITVSGTMYTNEGSSQMTTAGKTIKVVIGGTGTVYSTTTSAGSGYWYISEIDAPSLNGTVGVWTDGDANLRAYTLTKASSTTNNITGVDLYQNRIILKAEATSSVIAIADMAYDADNDTDIQFTANSNVLTVNAGQELHVWQNMIFTPGGTITLKGNAAAAPDGDFHLDDGATFNQGGAMSIAGNWTADASTTAVSNDYGVTFTATTTGKTITLPSTGNNSFDTLTFNGVGGAWTFASNASTTDDFIITNGTVTAPSALYIGGNYTNNGTFSHGNGTVYFIGGTKTMSGTLTGSSAFNNIVIGTGGGQGGDPSLWYNNNWESRKKITIDGTKIATTTDNFPVLIDITDTSLSGRAQADGDDILFTDDNGTTKLPHEIELYTSTSGRLVAWVKVSIASSTNKAIYMYYGNSATSSEQLATSVWDASYKMVHHFEETTNCSASSTDSTINAKHASCLGNVLATSTGKIGGAKAFSTSTATYDYYLNSNGAASVATGSISVSGWMKYAYATTSGARTIFSLSDLNSNNDVTLNYNNTTGRITFAVWTTAGNKSMSSNESSFNAGQWYHIVGTYESSVNSKIYIDGQLSTTSAALVGRGVTAAVTLHYGKFWNGTSAFGGVLDELRTYKGTLSAGWVATEYNNQNSPSTFYSVGSEQTRLWYGAGWAYRKPITLQGTKIATTTSNFPVLIDFTDIGLSTTTQADADDIVFTSGDGFTKLPHEVELYASSTGHVVAWVKNSIASSTSEVIYMYYGNGATSSEQLATSVWDSNYKGVWHLNGGTGSSTDSTSNVHHLTNQNVVSTSSGQIGLGSYFNENAVPEPQLFRQLPNGLSSISDYSISFWQNRLIGGGNDGVFAGNNPSNVDLEFDVRYPSGSTLRMYTNDNIFAPSFTTLYSDWEYVTFTRTGSTIRGYLNGVLDGTTGTDAGVIDSSSCLNIGAGITGTSCIGTTYMWKGSLDEVRLSLTARSQGWITTEYNNQNSTSTFTTIGSTEGYSAATSYTMNSTNASTTSITINTASQLIGPSAILSIAGNFINNGYFTAPATTTFNGAAQQTLSGGMTGANQFTGLIFINSSGSNPDTSPSIILSDSLTATTFAITTPSVKVRFGAGKTYTFTNINWNGQAAGTRVQFRSSATTTPWNLAVSGSQTVKNTNPVDSDASGGSPIDATDSSNLDGTRNTNWTFDSGTISCASNISTTTLGTLSLVGVSTATPHATTTNSCTAVSGCTISVSSAGNGSLAGLYKSAGAYLLPSATTTLSAGTEGYGIQAATSTAGTGASLSIHTTFYKSGNAVGGLTYANTTLASTTTTYLDKELVVTHKAAISAISPVGSYEDTVTYSCLAN